MPLDFCELNYRPEAVRPIRPIETFGFPIQLPGKALMAVKCAEIHLKGKCTIRKI